MFFEFSQIHRNLNIGIDILKNLKVQQSSTFRKQFAVNEQSTDQPY